jgi:UDP-3-O-[3-hydroxymyristoyl] glucosamine N-acyltransferase
MADPEFYANAGPLTLEQVAEIADATLHVGDAAHEIYDVAALEQATGESLAFLDNRRYVSSLSASQAGACVMKKSDVHYAPQGMAVLCTPEPYAAYARVAHALYPTVCNGLDSVASGVAEGAIIGKNVRLSSTACIGHGAVLGDDVVVDAYAVIGPGVRVGRGSVIGVSASVFYAHLGEGVIVHPGARIGQDGFGFAPSPNGVLKVPQLGRVILGDHVEVGANSTIDRGSNRDTVIGCHTKIDNLVQIGHNVEVGGYCFFASQVGISGSVTVGNHVMLGGQTGVAGHIKIGDHVQSAGQTGITQDIPAGAKVGGTPAVPIRQWHRQSVALAKWVKNKSLSA